MLIDCWVKIIYFLKCSLKYLKVRKLIVFLQQEEKQKAYRREKRKERKRKHNSVDDESGGGSGGMDPDMAAMMGFSGFGGSSKNN